MTKRYAVINKDVVMAARYIMAGRVVGVPTGTSYGLAANALDGFALQRVKNLKGRTNNKTFTVFMAPEVVEQHLALTEKERKLAQEMAGQPLTLLVKAKPSLRHLTKRGLVGWRLIDHPWLEKLAVETALPLTATSANRSGRAPCFSAADVVDEFPGLLPDELIDEDEPRGSSGTTYDLSLAAVLDGGELTPSKPTTIVKLEANGVVIARAGKLVRLTS